VLSDRPAVLLQELELELQELELLEGAIAHAVREPTSWLAVRPSATRCHTALQAAQLRLVLGFLHSERLTERCPVTLEAGRVTDTIVSCWQV